MYTPFFKEEESDLDTVLIDNIEEWVSSEDQDENQYNSVEGFLKVLFQGSDGSKSEIKEHEWNLIN